MLIKQYVLTMFNFLSEHPTFTSILGAVQAFIFGLWTIDTAIEWLKIVGEIFKFIGIICGSSVAVIGFVNTIFGNNNKKKDGHTNDGE